MKKIIFILIVTFIIISCSTSTKSIPNAKPSSSISDTIRIANDELEYEVIIIDARFSSWLYSQARPRGFYTENYLEGRNRVYVAEWNRRAMQPFNYNPNLYEMQINYNPSIHYGYEVNYLIYNYLIYFQITNKQQLAGFVPRI